MGVGIRRLGVGLWIGMRLGGWEIPVIYTDLWFEISPGDVFEPNLVLGSGQGKHYNPWTIPLFWDFFFNLLFIYKKYRYVHSLKYIIKGLGYGSKRSGIWISSSAERYYSQQQPQAVRTLQKYLIQGLRI